MIVVPDGILCNSDDEYIREYILGLKDKESGEFLGGKATLKAVVSLPNETFSISGTNTKTSFIYIQKKKHSSDKQGDVFTAVADHVGYIKKGKAEIPDPAGNDLVNITNCYKNGTDVPDGFRLLCRTVPKEELLVRWMNAGYYRQVYADIKQSLENKGFSLVVLGELAKCNRKKSKPDGDIFYVEIGDLDTATGTIVGGRRCSPADTPNNARRIIKKNDVLMSTRRPDRGAVALVEESYEGSFCSVFLARIQVIANKVKPGFLQQYLRTDVAKLFIVQRCTETTYPVISEDDIETIPVPVIEPKLQIKISENTHKAAAYQRAAEELRKESNELMNSILTGGPGSLKGEDARKELEGI